ncbi:MAG: hypothetical protein R2706_10340 [Acidimicrobiales bacterium]
MAVDSVRLPMPGNEAVYFLDARVDQGFAAKGNRRHCLVAVGNRANEGRV